MKHIYAFILMVFVMLPTKIFSQITINEFCASNASQIMDEATYNFSDWMEIYNSSSTQINMKGTFLTDNKEIPQKWAITKDVFIPANGSIIYWLDDNEQLPFHASFNLSTSGGFLGIYSSDGKWLDSLSYVKQNPNISMGRFPDGNAGFTPMRIPTPGKPNVQGANINLPKPTFSVVGGFYATKQMLTISSSLSGSFITYTVDGSEPKENGKVFQNPIELDTIMIVRARVWKSDAVPSEMVTQTYFIGQRKYTLPVISLSTDPRFLFNDTVGIYVSGVNGTTVLGGCDDVPRNWFQDWERPVNIEYFDTLGVQHINQYCGTKISGKCSRKLPQKSFAIFARRKYGKDEFKHKFFGNRTYNEFESLTIRNSGNDFNDTQFRDEMMQKLVNGINLDYQADVAVILFVNGKYWGVAHLKEKVNEDFVANLHNVDPDEVDMLEFNGEILEGDNSEYLQMIEFLKTHDVSKTENYEHIKTQIDIDEYINYVITELYIGNDDWPGNNQKYWRDNSPDAKWRWIMFDNDFGFGAGNGYPAPTGGVVAINNIGYTLDSTSVDWPNPAWSTLIIRRLLRNEEFKQQFLQRFATYMNTIFKPSRVIHIIDSIHNQLKPEMPFHFERFQFPDANVAAGWESRVQVLRNYALKRQAYVIKYLLDTFNIEAMKDISIQYFPPSAGYVSINGAIVKETTVSGAYFADFSTELKGLPHTGYDVEKIERSDVEVDTIRYITKKDVWKYLDDGSNQNTAWRLPTFSDAAWKSGNGAFGFGNLNASGLPYEATILAKGASGGSQYITYYFRKTFTHNAANRLQALKINLIRDDGVVVYVNGTEVLRNNMPTGEIFYNSLSSAVVGGSDDTIYHEFIIPLNVIKDGENVICAEVHQGSATSSDVSFDLELKAAAQILSNTTVINAESFAEKLQKAINVHVYFKPVEPITNLFINEFMADNKTGLTDESGNHPDWIEIYNAGNEAVNISRLFVSDSINYPTKWQMSKFSGEQAVLHPKSFLVLFADEDGKEGAQHTNFKLSKGGEAIVLTQVVGKDTTTLDLIEYPTQTTDRSMGRYGDGENFFKFLSLPTPGLSNLLSNKPPYFITTTLASATVGTAYQVVIQAKDDDVDDKIFFEIKNNLPAWLTFKDNEDGTATLEGMPTVGNLGKNTVTLTVNDAISQTKTEISFEIVVSNANSTALASINYEAVTLFPNPVENKLFVEMPAGIYAASVTIFDGLGRCVKQLGGEVLQSGFVDVSDLKTGVYIAHFRLNGTVVVRKVVKMYST